MSHKHWMQDCLEFLIFSFLFFSAGNTSSSNNIRVQLTRKKDRRSSVSDTNLMLSLYVEFSRRTDFSLNSLPMLPHLPDFLKTNLSFNFHKKKKIPYSCPPALLFSILAHLYIYIKRPHDFFSKRHSRTIIKFQIL